MFVTAVPSLELYGMNGWNQSQNMVSPGGETLPAGAVVEFGKRTCKPNSVVCGHSSRRRVAADTHQRPTRRFRQLLEPPGRVGPMRSGAWLLAHASLPIWSCSVWGLPCLRRYRRSGALLPHHFTLTGGLAVQAYALRASSAYAVTRAAGGIFSVALAVHGP